jgi:hypothetical protein
VNESWKLNLVDETATASFFPAQLKALKPNLIKEINLTTRDIALNKGGDLRRLVDNNSTFVNRSLAQHYQLAKIPVNDNTWESVSLNSNRSGLLTSGLALAAHSGNKYTSTTHRGLFVTIDLLCRYVPSPPGDVDDLAEEAGIDFPDTDTVRQRVNKLGTIQPCASCHVKFDPYGMVFENFNAFGQYFTTRYGETVDSTALINNQAVSNPKQLAGVLLTQQNELAQCLFDKMFTFASGYKLGSNITDLLGVYRIDDANKFELATLVKALATHENFRKVEGK